MSEPIYLAAGEPGLFLVHRTSDTAERKPPVPEAQSISATVRQRFWKAPEFDWQWQAWCRQGTHHAKTAEGHWTRRERFWAIRLPTLEALLAFVEQQGQCIFSQQPVRQLEYPRDSSTELPGGFATIEIYDDWRE